MASAAGHWHYYAGWADKIEVPRIERFQLGNFVGVLKDEVTDVPQQLAPIGGGGRPGRVPGAAARPVVDSPG
ncbi:hypothetical protein [Streptomyces sp. NPDC002133]|uniref:hypothetical protein n=1 Tax=Streptomyces sp. NPDC002133 TaxID=3154409 RepID=UPI003317E58F